MLDRPSLTNRVLEIAGEILAEQSRSRAIGVDDALREAGLTSMAMVRLMMATEIAFNIAIPTRICTPTIFAPYARSPRLSQGSSKRKTPRRSAVRAAATGYAARPFRATLP